MTTREILEIGKEVLTPRQFDVLRLTAAEYSLARIAIALDISETRARTLQRRAYQKLEIALREREAA